jgi:diphthine synthase
MELGFSSLGETRADLCVSKSARDVGTIQGLVEADAPPPHGNLKRSGCARRVSLKEKKREGQLANLLVFVGLGLDQSPSLAALEEMKRCDAIYLESYTSPLLDRTGPDHIFPGSLRGSPERVTREFVEDGTRILERSRKERVALLSSGDPLVATTHQDLRTRAIREGIETRVIHASSILCAVPGEFGLHSYNFGRPVSMTDERIQYTAYNTIFQNLLRGLHSTVLLQWDESRNYFLDPRTAVKSLLEAERDIKYGIVREDTLVLVGSRLGASDSRLSALRVGDLAPAEDAGDVGKHSKEEEKKKMNDEVLGAPPFVMVLPGRLHFTEREALAAITGRGPDHLFHDNSQNVVRISKSMVDRYSKRTERALERARASLAHAEFDPKGISKIQFDPVFENVEAYAEDAVRFINEGRDELAVLSMGYAEGLLDSLRFAGLLEFEW